MEQRVITSNTHAAKPPKTSEHFTRNNDNALTLFCRRPPPPSFKVHSEAFTASPPNTPNIHSRYLYCQIIIFRAGRGTVFRWTFKGNYSTGSTLSTTSRPAHSFGKDQINSEGLDWIGQKQSNLFEKCQTKQYCNVFHISSSKDIKLSKNLTHPHKKRVLAPQNASQCKSDPETITKCHTSADQRDARKQPDYVGYAKPRIISGPDMQLDVSNRREVGFESWSFSGIMWVTQTFININLMGNFTKVVRKYEKQHGWFSATKLFSINFDSMCWWIKCAPSCPTLLEKRMYLLYIIFCNRFI